MKQEFVTLPREAVERAIEALKSDRGMAIAFYLEISALRTALEKPQANQPAMTPIAQRKLDSLLAEGYTISGYSVYHEQKHQHGFVTGAGLVGWWRPEGVEHVQPQGAQEPFTVLVRKRSWLANQWEAAPRGFPDYGRSWADERVNVYTHPQPKREPLTDEQIDAIADAMPGGLEGFLRGWGWRQFARAVLEDTHNIK